MLTSTEYTTITGASAPADFTAKLAQTVALAEAVLGRPLESAVRTETVALFSDGMCFPKATPVTGASSLVFRGGSSYTLDDPDFPQDWLEVPVLSATDARLTYTGGYDEASAPTTLKAGLAWGVWTLDGQAGASAAPAGVASYTAGKSSVTYRAEIGADGEPLPEGLEGLRVLGGRAASLLANYRRVEV